MGVVLRMFRELARLGVSRAAAFFYAVAVGVVANVVIAHLSPHDGAAPTAPPTTWPTVAKTPEATATIAPRAREAKPTEPARAIEASAPATSLPPVPAAVVAPPVTPAALPPSPPQNLANIGSRTPPAQDASASLPNAGTMAAPLLKPTALPSAPQPAPPPVPPPASANAAPANAPPVAAPIVAPPIFAPPGTPAAAEAKPAPDQPASNVEAAAGANPAAPISLLPADTTQPATDPAPPKLSKPGPGSGGLY